MPDRAMSDHRIYVDFQKTDGPGRVVLGSTALSDTERYGVELKEGHPLHLYTDDLGDDGNRDDMIVDGVAHFDANSGRWVALVDWDTLRHISEVGSDVPGYGTSRFERKAS